MNCEIDEKMNCEIDEKIKNAYDKLKNQSAITISFDKFSKWVMKKGYSLYQRDRKRAKVEFKYTYTDYHSKICDAIQNIPNAGEDCYTGEKLAWDLIGQYDNSKAKQGGKKYKRKFALMPTLDHINAEAKPEFVICSWRMNDAKNDLSEFAFTKLCIRFLRKKGFKVKKN